MADLKSRERAARGMVDPQMDTKTHREQWPIKYPGLLFFAIASLFALGVSLWASV